MYLADLFLYNIKCVHVNCGQNGVVINKIHAQSFTNPL